MSELTFSGSTEIGKMKKVKAMTLRGLIWRRFMRHRLALVAMTALGLVVVSALLAPLSRYSPTEQNPANALQPPSHRALVWHG